MDQSWAPVVAALGASALTIFGTLGIDALRARRAGRAAREAKLQAAYRQLLTASALIIHSFDAMRLTAELRSGLQDGIGMLARQRKPLDPFDLVELLRRDLEPLYSALVDVYAVGAPDAIRVSNTVLNRATDVLDVLAELTHARLQSWRARVIGWQWSREEVDAYMARVRQLAAARRQLAKHGRRELRTEESDLWASEASTGLVSAAT
jgi:hypothetical protein